MNSSEPIRGVDDDSDLGRGVKVMIAGLLGIHWGPESPAVEAVSQSNQSSYRGPRYHCGLEGRMAMGLSLRQTYTFVNLLSPFLPKPPWVGHPITRFPSSANGPFPHVSGVHCGILLPESSKGRALC